MKGRKINAEPVPLTPRVWQVRQLLTMLLDAYVTGEEAPFSNTVAGVLCWNVGVWPMPPDFEKRLAALTVVAQRVLPLLDGQEPTHLLNGEDEHWQSNFAHWCKCVERQDGGGVRAGAALLGLWCHADALGHCLH